MAETLAARAALNEGLQAYLRQCALERFQRPLSATAYLDTLADERGSTPAEEANAARTALLAAMVRMAATHGLDVRAIVEQMDPANA